MKNLFVTIIALFMGITSFSQDLSLGVKGGVNFSNIRELKSFNLQAKTGFTAGVFVGIKFSGKIGVQADLLYSQQGAKFNEGDFDLTYVNIPVVLKYYLVDEQGFNVQVGPQFGFLVDDNINNLVNNIVNKAEANENDLSGVIGVGYDSPYGIFIDARYNLGFSDVSDDTKLKGGKNKYISLSLGYSFL